MNLDFPWLGLLAYAAALVGLFCVGKYGAVPLKWAVRLMVNALIGGAALLAFNAVAAPWGVHIGINAWTTLCVGTLGVPGFFALALLQLI